MVTYPKMSGAIPVLLLYAFMAWTGTTLPYLLCDKLFEDSEFRFVETTLTDREACNEFRTHIEEIHVVTHFKNCHLFYWCNMLKVRVYKTVLLVVLYVCYIR
jgi:hypothetical protein